MKVLHVIDSYALKGVLEKDVFVVQKGYSDYKRFLNLVKMQRPDMIHIHGIRGETFGIYGMLAWILKVKVVRTLYAPIVFSNWYTVKQLASRFFYKHTIVTSKYDLMCIDRFHIAPKGKRSLIYKGVDEKKPADIIKRDPARTFLYKHIGIGFTKTIRIIGTIIGTDKDTGIEHLIDAAYLADKYKNLTNTIFIVLCAEKISKDVQDQISELHIEGIVFALEDIENPEEYIKAFDVFISPRDKAGDLALLLSALYMQVPVIATKVGDAKEFEQYVAAPLVPPQSAKFLTEALMYVIRNENPAAAKVTAKNFVFPKKFTMEQEETMVRELYAKVAHGKMKRLRVG